MTMSQALSPRLLIFDLDGTLVDSQGAIARSFNVALATGGHDAVDHARVHRMIGMPLVDMFVACLDPAHHDAIPAYIVAYREHHGTVEIPRLAVFPGVVETLSTCRKAGLSIAVATNKNQQAADQVVELRGLRKLVDFVLGGDVLAEAKPHPAPVLYLLERFGRSPHEALVIGDSDYDMMMAAGAGVAACGVTYGAQSEASLRSAGAAYLLERMLDLLPIIGLAHEPAGPPALVDS
jgi:phosphoglycolate phosphatase